MWEEKGDDSDSDIDDIHHHHDHYHNHRHIIIIRHHIPVGESILAPTSRYLSGWLLEVRTQTQ